MLAGVDFSHAPAWLQWVLTVAAVAGAVGIIFGFIKKLWPALVRFAAMLSRFVSTVNALAELPQFIIDSGTWRTETQTTLTEQNKTLEDIRHEVQYNNGSSVKDAIARVEKGVAGLYVRADATDLNAKNMHDELEQTKPATPRRRKPTPKKETS